MKLQLFSLKYIKLTYFYHLKYMFFASYYKCCIKIIWKQVAKFFYKTLVFNVKVENFNLFINLG